MNVFTLASLFDGSGGFPLAAQMFGGRPVWASEIEPFAIAVTRERFPNMLHLGSVTEIDGGTAPPVDVITFGSPCQDLSIAGKKAGLNGSRSGLFFEALRIIKQMKEVANGKPRFIVWENVKGALTSNNGNDFKTVLESFAGLFGEQLRLPSIKKWNKSGHIDGGGWTISWRVIDAQFWGIPCRRPRLFVVVDCNGRSSGRILFNPRYEKICIEKIAKMAARPRPEMVRRSVGTLTTSSRTNYYAAWSDIGYTLCASDCKAAAILCDSEKKTVRCFTPTEYARFQGFPDNWAKIKPIPLLPENVHFWRKVWNTNTGLFNQRPKTYNQLRKWLLNPYSEPNEYKLWGNGVALPCVAFIMCGISEEMKKT